MAADYRTLLGLVREFVEATPMNTVIAGYGSLGIGISEDLLSRARAAIEPSPAKPMNDPAIVHTHAVDSCCSKHLVKAAREGKLDHIDRWPCPKCGTDWGKEIVHGVHHWTPVPAVVVFK
jgi:hypothetical protein